MTPNAGMVVAGISTFNNRVLIGTNIEGESTLDDLTIATSGDTGITIRSGTSSNGAIGFSDGTSGADEYRGIIDYDHNGDFLRFYTNATEKLRITSDGEVGISVSPASGHLLHIKNAGTAEAKVKIESESGYDARLILDTSNGGGAGAHIDFQIDGTAKGGIQYVTNGSASDQHSIIFRNNTYAERLRIDAGGGLQLGTSTATASKLTVYGANDAAAIFQGSNTGTGAGNGFITGNNGDVNAFVWNYENGFMHFGTNNVERLRIDSSGRLIQRYSAAPYGNRAATFQAPAGETSTYIAVVNTETNGASGILFGDHAGQNAGNFDAYINYSHQYQHMQFLVGSGTERLRINSNGAFGLGGANYGTSGQVLTSQGSGSAVQWATPSSGGMTLLHTMNINMTANTQSQSLNLTGYVKLMGLITGVSRSGGVNDTWLTFNGMNSSGNYSWVRTYLDNSNDTSTNRSGTSTGYAYGSVGPGFFINLAGIAAADSGNIDAEFTVHNLQESGRKIFTMTSRSYLVRYMVIDTRGSINTTSAITSFAINVSNAVSRNTGGTIKFYGVK